MKTKIENVDLSLTTKRSSLPTRNPVAGRFRLSPELDTASFVEEDCTIIFGDAKSKRIMQGKGCSVWWNPEKRTYKACITMTTERASVNQAEWNFEDCLNFIKRRIINERD